MHTCFYPGDGSTITRSGFNTQIHVITGGTSDWWLVKLWLKYHLSTFPKFQLLCPECWVLRMRLVLYLSQMSQRWSEPHPQQVHRHYFLWPKSTADLFSMLFDATSALEKLQKRVGCVLLRLHHPKKKKTCLDLCFVADLDDCIVLQGLWRCWDRDFRDETL